MKAIERYAVLGAGSWGTTLACLLADKGFHTTLWVREPELYELMRKTGENGTFLPGVRLPEGLHPCKGFDEALDGAGMVVCVVPSHGIRGVFGEARAFIQKDAIIVSAAKGIEEGTHLMASGILREALGGGTGPSIAVLSGPTFAREVAAGLPTAVTAASASAESASAVQRAFSTSYFRVYTNTDVIGVEVGGALKNVIAVASGISDGLGLGSNARAALITRGLAEITRLGVRLGASPATFSGLSGLGDLVLTCTGTLSRNYTVGFQVGQGKSVEEVLGGMNMVAEGVRTSHAAMELAALNSVEMPITEAVYRVLHQGKPAREAVFELMTRGLKGE